MLKLQVFSPLPKQLKNVIFVGKKSWIKHFDTSDVPGFLFLVVFVVFFFNQEERNQKVFIITIIVAINTNKIVLKK